MAAITWRKAAAVGALASMILIATPNPVQADSSPPVFTKQTDTWGHDMGCFAGFMLSQPVQLCIYAWFLDPKVPVSGATMGLSPSEFGRILDPANGMLATGFLPSGYGAYSIPAHITLTYDGCLYFFGQAQAGAGMSGVGCGPGIPTRQPLPEFTPAGVQPGGQP